MNQSILYIIVISIVLSLSGCAQPGRPLVKSDRGGLERMTETPTSGIYVLYGEMDANPEITCSLKRGDKLGFLIENGKNFAIAGEKRVEISAKKHYVWKLQED